MTIEVHGKISQELFGGYAGCDFCNKHISLIAS
jgi:hypothetical protein